MKLAIIGSRTFEDKALMWKYIRRYAIAEGWSITEVVSGGAKGADSLAIKFAKAYGLPSTEFLPDWERHGKGAGFIRNETIIAYCDEVIAFWDGQSKGTENSIFHAKRLKKPTTIIYF